MGKHVDVLGLHGEGGTWDVTISCEGCAHRIILKNGKLADINDRSSKDIEAHEYLAEFPETTLNSVCECIRVKVWLNKCGIEISEVIP